MISPDAFHFSASSLQDYLDCPRRFELKYFLNIEWPAIQSEPILEREQFLEDGKSFHQLIHQYLLGIPEDILTQSILSPSLLGWWQNFLSRKPHQQYKGTARPELRLSVLLDRHILVGQFDLIILGNDNAAVIIDWKTTTIKPGLKFYRSRIQTRLYPFLLARILESDKDSHWDLENIKFVYWFPEFPDFSLEFTYSPQQYDQDMEFFRNLLNQIIQTPPGSFNLTLDENRCKYCVYRSLCNRGEFPGSWYSEENLDNEALGNQIELDLDQIGEIEF